MIFKSLFKAFQLIAIKIASWKMKSNILYKSTGIVYIYIDFRNACNLRKWSFFLVNADICSQYLNIYFRRYQSWTQLYWVTIIEVYNCFRKKPHLFHSKIRKFNDARMCLWLTRFKCTLFVLSLKYAVTSVAYILEFGIYVFKD